MQRMVFYARSGLSGAHLVPSPYLIMRVRYKEQDEEPVGHQDSISKPD